MAVAATIIASCGDPAHPDTTESAVDGSLTGQSQCLGVPPARCNEYLRKTQQRGAVAVIRIVCMKPPCDDRQGQVTIDVLYADGNRSLMGETYSR